MTAEATAVRRPGTGPDRSALVVVGASLGGLEALQHLFAELPAEMPPIAVVQHRSVDPDGRLAELLAQHTPLRVVEPDDKTPIQPATIYLAPSDYHLLVEPGWFSLSTEAPVHHARPSIDVLLESAADAYGPRVIAALLTCASEDGVAGALAVRRHGGTVLVQDPVEARSPVLPAAVIAAGAASAVAPLDQLRRQLIRACLAPRPSRPSSVP